MHYRPTGVQVSPKIGWREENGAMNGKWIIDIGLWKKFEFREMRDLQGHGECDGRVG
jgi:hypothetical protein